jgi:hypothetical protein
MSVIRFRPALAWGAARLGGIERPFARYLPARNLFMWRYGPHVTHSPHFSANGSSGAHLG